MKKNNCLKLFREIFESQKQPVIIINHHLDLLFVNQAALELMPRLETCKNFSPILSHENDAEILQNALKENRSYSGNIYLSTPLLTPMPILLTPFPDDSGVGFLLFFPGFYTPHPVAAIPQDSAMIAAHELKMPLTMLFSSTRLLKRRSDPNDKTTSYYIDLIERNSYKLLRQINNIIELSNQQSGISKPNLSVVNICDLIRDLVYNSYTYMTELNIPFTCEIPDCQVLTACDPEKLERALLNLLTNAVKFSRPGNEVLIKLETDETYFTITMKDKGIGIDPKDLPHIFKPYFSSTRNGVAPGLGIGLSIVENIILMHHGRIFVESTVGEGSSFIINIPYNNAKSIDYLSQYVKNCYNDSMSQISIEFIPLLPAPVRI